MLAMLATMMVLGGEELLQSVPPPPSPYLEGVEELTLAWSVACARLGNGRVACWGDEGNELGYGRRPVLAPGLDDVAELASGAMFTCARRRSGAVSCWGSGENGELGSAPTDRCGKRGRPCATAPLEVRGLGKTVSLDACEQHACAVSADGTVRCWGTSPAVDVAGSKAPWRVPGISDAVQVVTGNAFACVRTRTGRARCWGHGSLKPAPVPGLSDATQLAAGEGAACALKKSGAVACWGAGIYLGDRSPMMKAREAPGPVLMNLETPLDGAKELWAETTHLCVRRADGVWCWGGMKAPGSALPEVAEAFCEEPVMYGLCFGARHVSKDPGVLRFHRNMDRSCVLLTSGRVRCDVEGLVAAP